MTQVVYSPQATEVKMISLLVHMAQEVEIAVDHAIESLLHCDQKLVPLILEKETAINAMEMHIDKAVFDALESRSLPAPEVRSVAFILKTNKDLERLADLATNIGRRVCEMAARKRVLDFSLLQPMAIAVSHICRQTLRALTHQDLTLASNVLCAASVDAYRDYVFRQLCSFSKPAAENEAVTLMLASRYLEQIADHTTTLAENLVMFLNEKRGQRARRNQIAS